MNHNHKNRYSIFSFRYILLVIISCLVFALLLLNTGCNNLPEVQNQSDNVETEAETGELSGNDSTGETGTEDSSSAETSEKGSDADAEAAQDNGDEASAEDTEAENSGNDSVTIRVYYANETGEYLVGETREIPYENRYLEALVELIKSPIDSTLYQLVPDTTTIYSIEIDNGVATVDLSQDFVDDRFNSDIMDNLLVYSIVNTLTEFTDINSVAFSVEGEKINSLGMLDLSSPLYRKNDLIIR